MNSKIDAQIGFIGGGNMAAALISGLFSKGLQRDRVRVAEPIEARRQWLADKFGVDTCESAITMIADCDVLVLAVKPQVTEQALAEIRQSLKQRQPLLLSIVAGIRCNTLARLSGLDRKIVRAMPNTPALVGHGMTGLFTDELQDSGTKIIAENIMQAVGEVVWVDRESDMDSITAVSGSGPAYFLLLIEALQKAAESLGLESSIAEKLSLQTALGTAVMAGQSEESAESLRRKVTSPNGTTEAAIKQLESNDFHAIIQTAVKSAAQRAAELAEESDR